MLRKTIIKHAGFFYPYFGYLLIGAIFLLSVDKPTSHQILNHFFWEPIHPFFAYITHLGDGAALAVVAGLLLFFQYRATIFVALAGILSGGVTQILKHQFFDEMMRPVFYFKHIHPGDYVPDLVPGVQTMIHNSFPSGHSTASFALFCSLAFITRRQFMRVEFFVLALVIAYSRIYLSQHFFVDTYVGSLIGVSGALFTYYLLGWLENRYSIHWWNKSLLKR